MDLQALTLGALVGGSAGTVAAFIAWALVARFVYRLWHDFDTLRTAALDELRSENVELRRRIEDLEKQREVRE